MCEDSDLQRLLDTVHSQPGAEILYQDVVRRGGVFGFFAREIHRIAYRVTAEACTAEAGTAEAETAADPTDAGWADTAVPAGELPELADLLASVDALESAGSAEQHHAAGSVVQPLPQHDFAALLRTLTDGEAVTDGLIAAGPAADGLIAAEPAAAEVATAEPAGPVTASADLPAGPVIAERVTSPWPLPEKPATKSNVTAFGRPDARARLDMLMQLRHVGVPVSVNPRADTHSLYEALENILEELPAPAMPPRGAGEVLAVVGESGPALQAAHTCAAMLRIPRNSIGVAGLPEHSDTELDYPWISGRQEALRLRTELSRTELPSIVVIATDATEAGSDDPWAAEMLAALRPTAVWAVVDARWKTEDSRAQLDRLGRVDALVVHSAQLSASPASVWDLDLPLGLLDGRAASTFAWTGLLFRLLRGGARHRASA
ncbi:MAG TPA: hypothetical protein VGX49_03045 [Jatrophihabitans sp.]|nr:hypothetical protein [Jatrophihabitans sp.]